MIVNIDDKLEQINPTAERYNAETETAEEDSDLNELTTPTRVQFTSLKHFKYQIQTRNQSFLNF